MLHGIQRERLLIWVAVPFPEFIAHPVHGFDALALGAVHHGRSVVHRPTQCEGTLVGHVSNPNQIARFHGGFRSVNAGPVQSAPFIKNGIAPWSTSTHLRASMCVKTAEC